MTEQTETPLPTGINYHQKSRVLEIRFADGACFNFPCEYLRVYSPSEQHGAPVHGKARVAIVDIEPREQVALRLGFDDGHCDDYSWPLLHALGEAQETNLAAYLQRLADAGLDRGDSHHGDPNAKRPVTVHYFIQLATISGTDKEDMLVPGSVTSVQALLAWLRKRGSAWTEAFAEDQVQVTVNRQFAEPYTVIEAHDEVAIVPRQK